MAPRRRRRTSARTARLTALGAANLVAVVVLGWLLATREWGPREPAVEAAPVAVVARPVAAPSDDLRSRWSARERGALERDLSAIVERWVERARRGSDGRVHAGNVTVAVHVRDGDGGAADQLGFDADRPLIPASNLKLVTTAAALVLLGPDGEFVTRAEAEGPIRAGRLEGDLVLRAGGDPLYELDGAGRVQPLLEPLVDALWARGVHAVAGDLVLDEGTFADPAPGPAWPDPTQHWTEYCALAGGFTANRGCLTATVRAARPGQAADVVVLPRGHGLSENLGVRTEAKGRLDVRMHARASGVLVRGSVPASARSWSESMAHPDPVELFGNVLVAAMSRRGILLEGRLRRERGAPGGERIATLRTPILGTLVPILRDSTNAVADQLFLATGLAVRGAATREASAAATGQALERLGVPSDGLVQVDGSGLSRDNRITARQVTALLAAVLALPGEAPELYRGALARAGETGTLDDRMRDGPARGRVFAKTGWISGASALSGIARTAGGGELLFSILVSYPRNAAGLNTSAWKPMQDEICERLMEVR